MDTNEIMVNEEVIEVTEEIATAGSGNGIKMAAGVGLAVLGRCSSLQVLVKPMVAKIKAKKEQARDGREFENFEDAEIDENLLKPSKWKDIVRRGRVTFNRLLSFFLLKGEKS